MHEWFKYLDDKDLNRYKSYHDRLYTCPECGAIFQEEACGGQSPFPWLGYHPTDGDCKIVSKDTGEKIIDRANKCMKIGLVKVITVKVLSKLIIDHK